GEQAVVDMRKLAEYALNSEHPKGADKALVFKSSLGITAQDSDLLRSAVLGAIKTQEAVLGQQNEFGQRYTVDFEMVGPNGKTATVRSGWIIRSSEDFP